MVEKNFNKKYGYAIILGSSTLIIGLLGFFLGVSPLYKATVTKNNEYKEKKAKLESLQTKKAKLEELKSKEEELTKSAETVRKALPTEKEIGRVFIQFDELVRGVNGQVNSISETGGTSAETTQIAAGLQKTVFTIPVNVPSYFKMKDLISNTENALRLMDINKVDVSVNNANTMNLNLTVTTYSGK